ncbi:hypothetical protein HFU84_09570 [Acidithiobacillus sp. CV18-2]|uniref:Uncharacterized protein n=1 Tax=Igneacidithiobacillus copahuensis TaxID=2724909 RepID=A0AAE2YRC7_9PROT|nr:hypothetical protein [Igneacidithiobacillus copahuensis]MBU2753245.1 hypothetical protein [Acidithiobacillus sp. CV18-3]MBU2757939.1 hypothetical protein [Acidithiobacillus sp. BN09-2]MBU2777748.1 hypothetical protein [Acidithiobacillus sp. CV18-2]MBU2796787.1 hypothetical protein [Acidithiobacillus sp. VAN18-2]MBU2800473.1 hypothetical protein [Acidithiobacillus sp. VAN18-4]UTV80260.1 hypothetical protein MQE22_09525 [Acidithiobacillus sp. YTS05]
MIARRKIFHIFVAAFSEIAILSIPVLIYLFFIIINVYAGKISELSLEMSLMSIIYYSDSVLVAKRIEHNTWNLAINVCLITLIIFSSSLFTLELLANGTKNAALIFKGGSGAYKDMQLANYALILSGFVTNLLLRWVADFQHELRRMAKTSEKIG